MKRIRIMPPIILLAAFLVMFALHFTLPVAKIVPNYWNLLGIIPLIAGVILNIRADKALHQASTTVKPFEESSTLVASGVYAISRHPMYLGFVLMLAGSAIILRSLSPWLVVTAFIVLMERIYIAVEERAMSAKFGKAYANYCQRVKRWL